MTSTPQRRVNWFSPLPPERSGIAEFTAQVAPWLRQRADARFITQASLEAHAIPGSAPLDSLVDSDLNRASVNVFNLGNNARFHDRLWQASVRAGGIVILHDARLQHLFAGMHLVINLVNHGGRERYCEVMREAYGIEGEAAARLAGDGRVGLETIAEAFPLVELALKGARGCVVHSDEALTIVRDRVRIPVVKLDLPYACDDDPGRAVRTGPNGRDRCLRLLAFGHLGPNRRIEPVLDAFARAAREVPLQLDLIGDVWNETLLRSRVHALGIAGAVTIHGHLPDAELERRLSKADLVINLRWPTMGEASYSQLRALSHGVATMVSRAGWYAELPEDAVIHVSIGDEIEQVARALVMAANDRAWLSHIGERGREHLRRHHSPSRYVDELLAFAGSVSTSLRPVSEALAAKIARQLVGVPDDAVQSILARIEETVNVPGPRMAHDMTCS